LTEPAPGWYNGYIMRNREDNMKKLRFTVEYNYSNRDSEWFYDVVDHHMLRDRRVVGWYTAKPSWKGDTNYGYTAAKEMADDLNDRHGYSSYNKHYNMSKLNSEAS